MSTSIKKKKWTRWSFSCLLSAYLCLARELLSLKLLLQWGCSHTWGLSPEWVRMCTVKADRYFNWWVSCWSWFPFLIIYLNKAFATTFFSTFEGSFVGMNTRMSNEIRSSTKCLFAAFKSTHKRSFKIRESFLNKFQYFHDLIIALIGGIFVYSRILLTWRLF